MVGNVSRLFRNYDNELFEEHSDLSADRAHLMKKIRHPMKLTLPVKPATPSKPLEPKQPLQPITFSQTDSETAVRSYLNLWTNHEHAWRDFETRPPTCLTIENIPFPPCDSDIIELMMIVNEVPDEKAAYRMACMRWHPDKFMQNFGSSICPQDIDQVIGKLNSICQSINHSYQLLQAKQKRINGAAK